MRGRALAAAASGAAHHGSDIPVSIAVALACDALHTGAWGGGNVRDGSVRDVWERARPLRYARDRSVEDLWGYCRSCYYAAECMGGCTWTAHSFFGKPGNNPYWHHRARELARAGLRSSGRRRAILQAPELGSPEPAATEVEQEQVIELGVGDVGQLGPARGADELRHRIAVAHHEHALAAMPRRDLLQQAGHVGGGTLDHGQAESARQRRCSLPRANGIAVENGRHRELLDRMHQCSRALDPQRSQRIPAAIAVGVPNQNQSRHLAAA